MKTHLLRFSILAISLSTSPALAQSYGQFMKGYPRTVMLCSNSAGGAQLREEVPGVTTFVMTLGAMGVRSGGEAKYKLKKSKVPGSQAESCTMTVNAGQGKDKASTSFTWTIPIDGKPDIKGKYPLDTGCELKLRYSKSIAVCEYPNDENLGSQCHGEGGFDMTAWLPTAQGPSKRKIIAYPGGMSIETDAEEHAQVSEGFAVWKNPEAPTEWCFKSKNIFPSGCKKLETRQEIKNSKGEIVGVLEISPKGESVAFKQTKPPYSETAFHVDEVAPVVKVAHSPRETRVYAQDSLGQKMGEMTILGSIDPARSFKSYERFAIDLTERKEWSTDCNGFINSVGFISPAGSASQNGAAPRTNSISAPAASSGTGEPKAKPAAK